MSDIKWIKICTDIFDDEKILLIESMPEADSIIVIWFKLLCLAGKQNNSGVFMLNDRIPYTDKMLATIFRRKESTVTMALRTFEDFGMIEIVDGAITIPKWGKHQSLDKIEKKNEYQKEYMREYRKKQRAKIGVTKYNEAGLDPTTWQNILIDFNYECAYCGCKEGLEQEHMIPVSRGGAYEVGNIVPACGRCNKSKGDKEVFSWYKEQPFWDSNRELALREYSRKYLRKTNVSCAEEEKEEEGEGEQKKKTRKASPTVTDDKATEMMEPMNISEPLREKVLEWLQYKREIGNTYKETGFKSLLKQVEQAEQKHGASAVMNQIDLAMSRSWQGMYLDKIQDTSRTNKTNNAGDNSAAAALERLKMKGYFS